MANWRELYERVKSVNVKQIFVETLDETSDTIINTIKYEQLEYGIKGDGNSIGIYKSKIYEEMKSRMNPKARGDVDLKYSGDWYNSLRFDKKAYGGIIKSNDKKDRMLTNKYGEDIKALTDAHKKEYMENPLRPLMMEKIRNAMQL